MLHPLNAGMRRLLLAALLAVVGVAPTTTAAAVTGQDAAFAAYPRQGPTQFVGLRSGSNDSALVNGCPAGTHHPMLRTYILSIPHFTLAASGSGSLHELRVRLADAPPAMPIIINRGPSQGLQQGLLDTRRFLADWAQVATEAPNGITMPSEGQRGDPPAGARAWGRALTEMKRLPAARRSSP